MAAASGSSSSPSIAHVDLTPTFRKLVSEHAPSSDPSSRRAQHSTRRQPPSRPREAEAWHRRRRAEQQWDQEARRLEVAVQSLQDFLTAVRRPYLHLGPSPTRYDELSKPRRYGEAEGEQSGDGDEGVSSSPIPEGSDQSGFMGYTQLAHLTESQKDEVDSHLKLVLERSVAKLKELIAADQARQASQPAPTATTAFARLLAPPLPPESIDSADYSRQLTSHRESITSLLGAKLKRQGERVGLMQEARAARKAQQAGPMAAKGRDSRDKQSAANSGATKAIPGSVSSFRATSAHSNATAAATAATASSSADSPPSGDSELTQSQMQQFASESSALTKSLEADQAAIQSIASTLSTISDLQETLITHLSVQNEAIGNLAGESIEQRVEVEKGNTELKRARERNRSANRMLGALLVGSGLGLLFLHVMD